MFCGSMNPIKAIMIALGHLILACAAILNFTMTTAVFGPAALVGGNAARVKVAPIGNIPVIILIIMIGIIMSYTTCTRPTWLTFNLHTKQEQNCNNLVSISLELLQTKPSIATKRCTSWSNRNAENGWQDFSGMKLLHNDKVTTSAAMTNTENLQ